MKLIECLSFKLTGCVSNEVSKGGNIKKFYALFFSLNMNNSLSIVNYLA